MHHQVMPPLDAFPSAVHGREWEGYLAVTVVMPSLICHQAFNKKYLGPPGNQPVVPLHQLPYKDDDDELKPITIQAFNMHTIALLAQHQCWVQAVVTTGDETVEPPDAGLMAMVKGQIDTFNANNKKEEKEERWVQGPLIPCPKLKEGQTLKITIRGPGDTEDTVLYVKAVAKKKDDGAEKDDGVGSKKDETEEASSSDSGEDIDSDCSYGEQEEEEEVDDSYKFCSI
ncbi:hypothetical protein SEMRO_497_G154810.1 [Seminavis robusta]|uniref:Uncharacterized protein n=1 Tax=Seminavis robusta TaxID=568900 RepID=A0A9N8DZD4_9STRA|nr:hypothetical protein SEMRO_497_G154810.1 [Seminavis robusta]|eukprot:Sro497_g154810.1 n/a (228) ;mRNA; r:38246-39119